MRRAAILCLLVSACEHTVGERGAVGVGPLDAAPPPAAALPPSATYAPGPRCILVGCTSTVTLVAHPGVSDEALVGASMTLCLRDQCWSPAIARGLHGEVECTVRDAHRLHGCEMKQVGSEATIRVTLEIDERTELADGDRLSIVLRVHGKTLLDHRRSLRYALYSGMGPVPDGGTCMQVCHVAGAEIFPSSEREKACGAAACE
jgi:hypothetical protein